MALLYDATITPGKRDLMKGWLPSRSWFDGDLARKPHAAFRFDDPAGEVASSVSCSARRAARATGRTPRRT